MPVSIWDYVNPIDTEEAARAFRSADPLPHIVIDDFLRGDFARQVVESYPSYDEAVKRGFSFSALNEKLKVQVTDASAFAESVQTLNEALASPEFLEVLERITGIPRLLADPQLAGGGMHLMASGGRLDVHVDFNYVEQRGLHRRLNILVFLNEKWEDTWGGHLELWRPDVKSRIVSLLPLLNRCVVFETSETSYHGVTKLRCPTNVSRNSFAGYYYTKEPPPGWDGTIHSTMFRARPDERWRGAVLMPLRRILRATRLALRRAKRRLLRSSPR